jgi:protease-4
MRFIIRFLAVIGLLFIVLVAGGIFVVSRVSMAGRQPTPIADGSVLTLAVEGPFAEESPTRSGLAAMLGSHPKKLREITAAIDHAAGDSRIKGLVLKIDQSAGMAQTQELRAAIAHLRAGGKFAYAFADDFGESAAGNGQYYLAAACDQIWLQPMGTAMLTDVAFEEPFLKGAFAKLDVEPEFVKRAEYKTAPETFTEAGFTPAAREMMESLANDLTQQLVTDIAASRAQPADAVRGWLAKGPLGADEALQARIVDHVGYADEVLEAAKKAAGATGGIVPLGDYYRQAVSEKTGAPNIALIYEVGDIDSASGPIDPMGPEHGIDQQSAVIEGFAKATANPSVKAIVFRINSPGGSVTGSEALRRMVVKARAAGKKVVVSMASVAASGGYWISADADKIVAEPATLTGSIGVFSGKFMVGKGLADIGVTADRTTGGPFTGMDSPFHEFTPDQSQRINAEIDTVYGGFVGRVADGRKIPAATVAQSAKGRVWTGQQAKQIGLVDALGGLEDAIKLARETAGIGADEASVIRVYPEPVSPLEAVRAILNGEAGVTGEARAALAAMGGPLGTAMRALMLLSGDHAGMRAEMPDLGTVR